MTEIEIKTNTGELKLKIGELKLKILGVSDKRLTWDEAKEYCEEQGGRLPTVEELQIISALQRAKQIDTDFEGYFWSSSQDSQIHAYNVGLTFGNTYNVNKYIQYGVLCLGK